MTIEQENQEESLPESQEQEQPEVEQEEQQLEAVEESDTEGKQEQEEQEAPEWLSEAQELANIAAGKAKKKERAKQERLQAKLKSEHDEELERIKAEYESRLNSPPDTQQYKEHTLAKPKRPRESDFETYEEYEDARDRYDDELYTYRRKVDQEQIAKEQEQAKIAEAQQKAIAQRKEKIAAHYARAESLVDDDKNPITDEAYRASDMMFRQSLGSDDIADALIERMGEGSEKVVLSIGINAEKREKLNKLLARDPTGIEAAIYLGEQKRAVSSSGKVSRARKPAPVVKGNGSKTDQLQAKYKEALSKNDAQAAYNIKKQARENKINTKEW